MENFLPMEGVQKCYKKGQIVPNGGPDLNINRPFSSVYNGVIHPFVRHTIKGIITQLGISFGS